MNRKPVIWGMILTLVFCGSFSSRLAAESNQPLEMEADIIEYNSVSGDLTARGGVTMNQGGAVLTGQQAEYNTKTKEAHVTGGVKVIRDNATLTAAEARAYDNNHIIATGEVVLTKGDNTLTGPQVDYYSDRNYAVAINNARLTMAEGVMTAVTIEAFMNENRAVGKGDVHIVSEVRKLDATADQADYYGGEQGQGGKAILTGNPRAVQDGNVLTGNSLIIYLDNKVMNAEGKTKLIIQPQ